MRSLLFVGCMLVYGLCAGQGNIEDHYKIYDTRSKELISIEKIIDACNKADVLFFGEEHNDSVGHFLENKIFTLLHQRYGGHLALSLEMFETDNQLVLDEYLAGTITEDRLSKDARLWSNYKDYRPMIEYARKNKIPVIAADPPRRYVSLVTRRGMRSLDSLSSSSKKFLPPLPYDTATGRYYEKFTALMSNGGGGPTSGSANIYYSQNLWDAGMSYSIYSFWKKHKDKKVFHCVGRFHSDEKLGTLAQLQKRKSRLSILNISCFSDASFENPDWNKFSNLGDFIIVTDPSVPKSY
ncbi:MAG TPA: ChaN family lipoprotein [Chitinophagaceae bacterium]|nr:ChaN family lipoprotein [Chitinophagaceae bacterium]